MVLISESLQDLPQLSETSSVFPARTLQLLSWGMVLTRLSPIPPGRSLVLRFPKLANLGERVNPMLLGYSQIYVFATGSRQ